MSLKRIEKLESNRRSNQMTKIFGTLSLKDNKQPFIITELIETKIERRTEMEMGIEIEMVIEVVEIDYPPLIYSLPWYPEYTLYQHRRR